VKVQSGQSRSGQAGSESCLWSGNWPELKRGQQESGPRGFSSEIVRGCEAEAVDSAEGNYYFYAGIAGGKISEAIYMAK
jgi:hypothetical protein